MFANLVRIRSLATASVLVMAMAVAVGGAMTVAKGHSRVVSVSALFAASDAKELVQRADAIAVIEVVGASKAHWNSTDGASWGDLAVNSWIYNDTPVTVVRLIRGSVPTDLTLRLVGGEADGVQLNLEGGGPALHDGEGRQRVIERLAGRRTGPSTERQHRGGSVGVIARLRAFALLGVQVAVLAACTPQTRVFVDGASAATFHGRSYFGTGQEVFLPIDRSMLTPSGRVDSTNEPNTQLDAMALPGVPVDRAFVLLRNDGTLVVFVPADAIPNGRSVGVGVPELCPYIKNKSAEGCPSPS